MLKDSEIELKDVQVGKGSFVALPAGKIHTWSNAGSIPARIFALLTPSGIANGFETVGAAAGQFPDAASVYPHPDGHPLLQNNNNCSGSSTVNCVVPTVPGFYDFVAQVNAAPGVLDTLGFNPIPLTLPNARCPVVYSSAGFKVDPSDTQINADCSDTLIPASTTPFDNTFDNPFSLTRFGQTAGPLSPDSVLAVNLFGIDNGQIYNTSSHNSELFRVLEGELTFDLGGQKKVATAGTSVYIAPDNPFSLIGDTTKAKLLQFSVASIPENRTLWGIMAVAFYLGVTHRKSRG